MAAVASESLLGADTQAWLAQFQDEETRGRYMALATDLGARMLRMAEYNSLVPAPAKGAQGENEIYEILSRARRFRDVSRRAHSGDMLCDTGAGPVLVEVKHYQSSVPAAEVEKMLRDIREHSASAGVLLSLTSAVVGHKSSVSVVLETRVDAGTLVPVVYAMPARGSARLSPDVALAAVDMAAALAEVYPRGIRGLHGRSSALAYAVAAEQLADSAAGVRSDLASCAGRLGADIAALGDRIAGICRETRALARAQRAEVEDVVSAPAADLVEALLARYQPAAAREHVEAVVAAVEQTSALAGLLDDTGTWRLLKTRAVHAESGCALHFAKGATHLQVPAKRLSAERIAATVKAHPEKTSLADGLLALELGDATVAAAAALVD